MSKRKIYLIIILIVWIIIGYLVYTKLIKRSPQIEPAQVTEPEEKRFEINVLKEMLESEELKNLVTFGDLPIRIKDTEKGRKNPFIPY